tara:strand:- start:1130 stop:1462 length:333 start_codon:yes stop_codon:yes gene_type:complete
VQTPELVRGVLDSKRYAHLFHRQSSGGFYFIACLSISQSAGFKLLLSQFFLCIRVVDFAAGGTHMIALTDANEVYVWGWGNEGRLGFGEAFEDNQLSPKRLDVLCDKGMR